MSSSPSSSSSLRLFRVLLVTTAVSLYSSPLVLSHNWDYAFFEKAEACLKKAPLMDKAEDCLKKAPKLNFQIRTLKRNIATLKEILAEHNLPTLALLTEGKGNCISVTGTKQRSSAGYVKITIVDDHNTKYLVHEGYLKINEKKTICTSITIKEIRVSATENDGVGFFVQSYLEDDKNPPRDLRCNVKCENVGIEKKNRYACWVKKVPANQEKAYRYGGRGDDLIFDNTPNPPKSTDGKGNCISVTGLNEAAPVLITFTSDEYTNLPFFVYDDVLKVKVGETEQVKLCTSVTIKEVRVRVRSTSVDNETAFTVQSYREDDDKPKSNAKCTKTVAKEQKHYACTFDDSVL